MVCTMLLAAVALRRSLRVPEADAARVHRRSIKILCRKDSNRDNPTVPEIDAIRLAVRLDVNGNSSTRSRHRLPIGLQLSSRAVGDIGLNAAVGVHYEDV